jgi:acetoin utilization deacetylase AcuC-like enzyme
VASWSGLTRGLARRWRAVEHAFGAPSARLVYHRDYANLPASRPIDPARGERVLVSLAAEGLARRRDVTAPPEATFTQLRRVHGPEYLESLQRPQVLATILGVDAHTLEVDRALDLLRRVVGGTVTALELALRDDGVALHVGGGFHHARPDRGHGFCVFNDVAIAIAELRAQGFRGRVLVVDLDLHDGDGTRLCFAEDPSVHTLSIHNETWDATPAVEATTIALGAEVDDATFTRALREALPRVIGRFEPALVVYVAGVDGAADDHLGNWRLSPQAIAARDRFVFDLVRRAWRRRPLAVVIAGGYGPEAWRYTARFFGEILAGRPVEPPTTEDLTVARIRYLSRVIEPFSLTGGEDAWITEDDVGELFGREARSSSRFLGFYTRHGLELALERYGTFARLEALGFRGPIVDFDLGQPLGDLLRVYGDAHKRELLMELRARRDARIIPGHEVLFIDWLLLQNPRLGFTADRPALPGQKHPGLGMLAEVMALLAVCCERLSLSGMVFVPAHYHTAYQSRRRLRFASPRDEGRFRALAAALSGLSLREASWAVARGQVVERETGQVLMWTGQPMVLPLSPALTAELDAPAYVAEVAEVEAHTHFDVLRAR